MCACKHCDTSSVAAGRPDPDGRWHTVVHVADLSPVPFKVSIFGDNARIISAGMYVEVMNRAAAFSKFSSHDRSDESVVKVVYVKEGGKFVRSVSKLCRHLC